MSNFYQLAVLAIAAFIQNMAFTWVSRSRNSGDPNYHRYAAICSNGVWFIVQILMMNQVWKSLTEGDWLRILITAVVYVAATTEGSVLMMRILLKKETGKRKVGAQ